MDFFDFMSGNTPPNIKKKKEKSGGALLEREGIAVRLLQNSLIFFDDKAGMEVFVPISQIKDWWFTTSGSKRGLRLEDLELDDEITLVIPKWLVAKEGMLR